MTVCPFSPGLADGPTLEELRVGRDEVLDGLSDRVRDMGRSGARHHGLLIGGPGLGKTFLLTLLHDRIARDPKLAASVRVAWLEEREWGVASVVDLWLRILRALGVDPPEVGPREAAAGLEARLREEAADRPLLVLVENLDAVLDAIGEEGQQRLRAFLQDHDRLSIVATAPRLCDAVSQPAAPLYGLFRIRHLDELDLAAARSLLVRHMGPDGVLAAPDLDTAVRVLHDLAGGNHLFHVLFARALAQTPASRRAALVEPFLVAADALRPRFEADLARLSAQQRKIADLLLHRRRPVRVQEIAAGCLVTHQTASSQLRALRAEQIVRSHAVGRLSLYEVADPLRRLAFEAGTRRGARLRALVSLLRAFHALRRGQDAAGSEAALGREAAGRLAGILQGSADVEAWRREGGRLLADLDAQDGAAALAAALAGLAPFDGTDLLARAALERWVETWARLTAGRPLFAPALAVLRCAIDLRGGYDRRQGLALPLEERALLEALVAPEDA